MCIVPLFAVLEVVTGEHGNYTKQLVEAAKTDIWRKAKAIEGNYNTRVV